jgi:hypothetical protein
MRHPDAVRNLFIVNSFGYGADIGCTLTAALDSPVMCLPFRVSFVTGDDAPRAEPYRPSPTMHGMVTITQLASKGV